MKTSNLLSTLLLVGTAAAQIIFPNRENAADKNILSSDQTSNDESHLASDRASTNVLNTKVGRSIFPGDESSSLHNVEIIEETVDYITEVTHGDIDHNSTATVEAGEHRQGRHSSRFVFEDENKETVNEVQPEPECDQDNICTNLPDYPDRIMLKALRRGNRLTKALIKSMASTSAPLTESAAAAARGRSGDIGLRFGFGDKEVESNICRTLSRKVTPRGAKNTKGDFMWILNRPEGKEEYIQVVDTTQCQDAGEQCLGGELFGHVTSCKQEYSEHKLLALDTQGQQIVIDTFRFPSCCTCHVNRGFSIE